MLLVVAAVLALVAVWRWDRTHVVVTDREAVHRPRRRAEAGRCGAAREGGTVEIDQSLLGRLLGYGTVVAGDLEIACVPHPRELCGLVQRLSG